MRLHHEPGVALRRAAERTGPVPDGSESSVANVEVVGPVEILSEVRVGDIEFVVVRERTQSSKVEPQRCPPRGGNRIRTAKKVLAEVEVARGGPVSAGSNRQPIAAGWYAGHRERSVRQANPLHRRPRASILKGDSDVGVGQIFGLGDVSGCRQISVNG